MTIYEKLSAIQAELSVPKNQYNDFGGFSYRSCEDILEKVKPLCKKYYTVLAMTDTLEQIGIRYYVKSAVTLQDLESTDSVCAAGYSREEETKKGMDGSQITGASSSYARKYALNGLFCIDDVKDSDFTNQGGKPKSVTAPVNVQPNPQSTSNSNTFVLCESCGRGIPEKVASYSMSKYKRLLCMDCQKLSRSSITGINEH